MISAVLPIPSNSGILSPLRSFIFLIFDASLFTPLYPHDDVVPMFSPIHRRSLETLLLVNYSCFVLAAVDVLACRLQLAELLLDGR